MPKQVNVKLGSREYVVAEKFSAIAEKWRKVLRESSIYQTLQSLDGVIELVAKIAESNQGRLDVGQVTTLAHVVPTVLTALANSMDDINALVYDYVPEMAADREWIGLNVYDSEMVAVFVEVLKLNFPIMGAWELFRGLKALGTSTNLPKPNGASGLPSSAPRKRTSTSSSTRTSVASNGK